MIIRTKFNGYVNGNNRLYPGGGGGPTTSYSQTSNIPEYAQPYVEKMLGATEKQVFTEDSNGNPTGFQPYKPYQGETVAGFSPMQQQAMQGIQNYQLPDQTGAASRMTGYAGLGALGEGQRYSQQATDPNATSAYMSPYIQNALQPQMQEAARQSDIQGQQNAGQAVNAGAFGGSRFGLQEAERQRNLGTLQNQIYGQGMQNAFQNAQQAQQFGSNLNMQGYGIANQSANQLGNLGQQQYGQEMGLLGQQQAVGGQQQQYEQQRLNQNIQNYATAQQYPFIQLGTLSNMLRGLPMQASTTQMYQAQPSMLQQGIGLAGAGSQLYQSGMFGKAEGGEIKEMASGGIATGVNPYQLPGMLEKLSDQQLSTKENDKQVDPATKEMVDAEKARRSDMRNSAGIMHAANGGVVAFAKGGTDEVDNPFKEEDAVAEEVPSKGIAPAPAPAPKAKAAAPDQYKSFINKYLNADVMDTPEGKASREERDRLQQEVKNGVEGQMAKREALYQKYGIDPIAIINKQRQEQEDLKGKTEEDARKTEHLRYAQMFAKFGSTPGPILKAALVSMNDTIPDLLDDQAKVKAAQKEISKTLAELDRSELLYKQGNVDDADKKNQEAIARLTTMNLALTKAHEEQLKGQAQVAGTLEGHQIAKEATLGAAAIHQKGEDRRQDLAQQRLEGQQSAAGLAHMDKWEKANGGDMYQSAKTALSMSPDMDEKQKATFQKLISEHEKARLAEMAAVRQAFPYANLGDIESKTVAAPSAKIDASQWGEPKVKT